MHHPTLHIEISSPNGETSTLNPPSNLYSATSTDSLVISPRLDTVPPRRKTNVLPLSEVGKDKKKKASKGAVKVASKVGVKAVAAKVTSKVASKPETSKKPIPVVVQTNRTTTTKPTKLTSGKSAPTRPQRINSVASSLSSASSALTLSRTNSVGSMQGNVSARSAVGKGNGKATKNTHTPKPTPHSHTPKPTFPTKKFLPKSRLDHLLHESNDFHAYNSFKHENCFRNVMENRVLMRIFSYLDWASLWAKVLYLKLEKHLQLQVHYGHNAIRSMSGISPSSRSAAMELSESLSELSPSERAQENRERVKNYNHVGGHLVDLQTLRGSSHSSASSLDLPNYHNGIMDLDYWNDTAPYTDVLSKLLIADFWGKRQGEVFCFQQTMNLRNRSRGFPQRIALSDPQKYFVYDCLTDHVESRFPLRTWYRSFPVWAAIQRFEAPCIITVDDLAILEDICSRGALERADGSICRLSVELDCVVFNRERGHDVSFKKFLSQSQHYIDELCIKWPLQRATLETLFSSGIELEELRHFALLNTRLPQNIVTLKDIAPNLESITFVAASVDDYELMLREFGTTVQRMEIVLAGNVQPPRLELLFTGHSLRELKVVRAHTFEPMIWEGPETECVGTWDGTIVPTLRALSLYQSYENAQNLTAIARGVKASNIVSLLIGSSVDNTATKGKYLRSLFSSGKLERLMLIGESGAVLSKRLNALLSGGAGVGKTIYLPASVNRKEIRKGKGVHLRVLEKAQIPGRAVSFVDG